MKYDWLCDRLRQAQPDNASPGSDGAGNVVGKIKSAFVAELNKEGDLWRIFRRPTLVDHIRLSYAKFQRHHDEESLVNLINYALKAKVLTDLPKLHLTENLSNTITLFNKENEQIVALYDKALNNILAKVEQYKDRSTYDLNNEVGYLQLINQLELTDYSDEVFDQLICVAINSLAERLS